MAAADDGRGPAGAAPWRSADAQVLVEDLTAPGLDDAQAHHLVRVLRLRPGALVCATDGAGGWRRCTLGDAATLEPFDDVRRVDPPCDPITVAFALVKGDRPELVVQKLTELGVDRIVAFVAARSVVRPDPSRAQRQLERLRRVAAGACAQSRRLHLPAVEHAGDAASVVAAAAGPVRPVVADVGGRAPIAVDRIVLVGPEGGWAPGEVDDLERVSLAEHVLRAETAAIAAGALLASLRSGRLGPAAGAPAPTPPAPDHPA